MSSKKPILSDSIYDELHTAAHSFIDSEFEPVSNIVVSLSRLYVSCRSIKDKKIEYVNIKKTPHYVFAMNVLHGTPVLNTFGYQDYPHYISLNWHPCDADCFFNLIQSIRHNGYKAINHPILVTKSLWRPWPLNRFDVIDGLHRLAVLAALGEDCVQVRKMRIKRPLYLRIYYRIRSLI